MAAASKTFKIATMMCLAHRTWTRFATVSNMFKTIKGMEICFVSLYSLPLSGIVLPSHKKGRMRCLGNGGF